jgi:hypothetical protein
MNNLQMRKLTESEMSQVQGGGLAGVLLFFAVGSYLVTLAEYIGGAGSNESRLPEMQPWPCH